MKWEPGDTISLCSRSLPAELLIFPSSAEMIFCPSLYSESVPDNCPIFRLILKSRWAESSKLEPGWEALVRNHIRAPTCRRAREGEEDVSTCWRWRCCEGWRRRLNCWTEIRLRKRKRKRSLLKRIIWSNRSQSVRSQWQHKKWKRYFLTLFTCTTRSSLTFPGPNTIKISPVVTLF